MKKVLTIIGGIVVALIAIFVIVFVIVSSTSKKLVCKSSQGNITIMYNDETLKGYTSTGLIYDFEGQKVIANQLGTEEYISQFKTWFSINTDGTCEAK